MIRTLIVEDEKPSAKKLAFLLAELDPQMEVVAFLESIAETVNFLENNTVDLIFMDIHLADGNCFKIFEQVEVHTPIIFTTAYDQYAIVAFKQNSLDYLLKPIDREELAKSVEKYHRLVKYVTSSKSEAEVSIDYAQLAAAISNKKSTPAYKSRFMVHYRDTIRTVPTDDIAYFFAESKAVFLSDQQGKIYDVNYTLDKLLEQLDPKKFFRINRKFIVSIESIKEVYVYSKSKLKVEVDPDPGFEVIVPTEKLTRFKAWLSE